jgi:hypothetical protein
MAVIGGPDPIVTDDLILLLDAGNKQSYPGSGTTWFDISGKENDVTMTNATWNSNGYWLFDGVSDYGIISSLNGFTNTTNATVFCIFRSSMTGNGSLLGFGTEAANTNDIYQWTTNNRHGLNTWNSDSWGVENVVTANSTANIAATYQFKFGGSNKEGFNMFINGQEQTETQVAGTTLDRTRSTQFGIGLNGWRTSAQTWNGRIYYLAVYNDSVTTAKALQNYKFYNNNRFV